MSEDLIHSNPHLRSTSLSLSGTRSPQPSTKSNFSPQPFAMPMDPYRLALSLRRIREERFFLATDLQTTCGLTHHPGLVKAVWMIGSAL